MFSSVEAVHAPRTWPTSELKIRFNVSNLQNSNDRMNKRLTFQIRDISVSQWAGVNGKSLLIMQNTFEEIREQIHEIRNMLGPIDFKLDSLDHKITVGRISFEAKATSLETKIATESLRISDQWSKISEHSDELAQQSERIRRIELLLKIPVNTEKTVPAAVHEDKLNPAGIPPQTPQA
jgi:hypothetical protein